MAIFVIVFQLIWFLIIFMIATSIIKAAKNTNGTIKKSFTTMGDINKIIKEKSRDIVREGNFKYSNNNNKDSKNTYFNNEKIDQYKNQESIHTSHDLPNETSDLNKIIGYKKCPNCENTVSIKSEECFICGYKFED